MPGAKIKGGDKEGGGQQDSVMPTAMELEVAVAVANVNLAQLVWKQVEAKD